MQTKHLTSLVTLGMALMSIPVMPSHAQEAKIPTVYKLSNPQIKVTYSTTSFTGEARLDYEDKQQKLQFAGDDIKIEDTAMGQIATVTIYKSTDNGNVTFSLLLPNVILRNSNEAKIITQGITTENRLPTLPLLNQGQTQIYQVAPLFGTAASVAF
jgi:hypothetical protein